MKQNPQFPGGIWLGGSLFPIWRWDLANLPQVEGLRWERLSVELSQFDGQEFTLFTCDKTVVDLENPELWQILV